MADADVLRTDFSGMADDDALVIVYIPREGKDRPVRHLRFYQVDKATVWGGTGNGLDMPPYVVPPDDPPPPQSPPPPAPTTTNLAVVTDWLKVRAQSNLKGNQLRLVKRGTVLSVVVESAPIIADGYEWVRLSGENAYLAKQSTDGKAVYLAPKA